MSTNIQEGWADRFDDKFGKAGPEKNSDSIGKSAGCDDCSYNIKEREDHRQFVSQEILAAKKEVINDILDMNLTYRTYPQLEGADRAIEIPEILKYAKSKGIDIN